MTKITQASPYTPKVSPLKKTFNWIEQQIGLKPKPKELTEKEKAVLQKNDTVHYSLINEHPEDVAFAKKIMDVVSKSDEGVKLIDKFYKSGGKIALVANKNFGALYVDKKNHILLNVSPSRSRPTDDDIINSLATTVIHEAKHSQQNKENNIRSHQPNESMETTLMDYRIKEGDATASQFIGAMQMAMTKDAPTTKPITHYSKMYSAQFEAGVKALGLVSKDTKFEDIKPSELDFSKVDDIKLNNVRQDVMLAWANDERTTGMYGDFIGKQAWMAGAMAGTLDKNIDAKAIAMNACKTPDGKAYFTKEKADLYDKGYLQMGDAAIEGMKDKIKWYETYGSENEEKLRDADKKYYDYIADFDKLKNTISKNGGKLPTQQPKKSQGIFAKLKSKER